MKYLRWPESYRDTKIGVDDFLAGMGGTTQDLHQMAQDAPDEDAIPIGTWMSEIEPERVEWMWDRRIPFGKVTMLDGDPGRGKSMILYDLAARTSGGRTRSRAGSPAARMKRSCWGVVRSSHRAVSESTWKACTTPPGM